MLYIKILFKKFTFLGILNFRMPFKTKSNSPMEELKLKEYTKEGMTNAPRAVGSGNLIAGATQKYGIPRQTLNSKNGSLLGKLNPNNFDL